MRQSRLVLPRRSLLLAAPALVLPHRRRAHAATLVLPSVVVNPATNTPWPGQPGNPVGFAAAPTYTGSLTAVPKANFTTSAFGSNNGVYTGLLFDAGTSPIKLAGTGMTFNGCYFGASGGGSGTTSLNYTMMSLAGNAGPITFNYCTFAPSPSYVGGSFPPQPPSGGGYTTWPSYHGDGVAGGIGINYAPFNNGQSPPSGGLTYNSCDMWGCSQGPGFYKVNASCPFTFNNSWTHDPPSSVSGTFAGYHQDGIGDTQGTASDYDGYISIVNSTICAQWNSQGIAFQGPVGNTIGPVTITGNYLGGGSAVVSLGPNVPATGPLVFANNTFGSPYFYGATSCYFLMYGAGYPSYFKISGSGNRWRGNTILPGTYVINGRNVVVASGATNYVWPDNTISTTEWTGAY